MRMFSKQLAVILAMAFFFSACKKTEAPAVSSDEAIAMQKAALNKKAADQMAGPVKVFATGLNNPRGLKFGPDGHLYVAEAGAGGSNTTIGLCEQVVFPVGPYHGSPTGGRISKIDAAGVRTTVTDQLPSSMANELIGGDVEGVADVGFIGNQLYGLLAGAGCSHGVPNVPNGIVRVAPNGSWTLVANISSFMHSHPVQNPNPSDFEPDGTPYSMTVVRGEFYVVEPNSGQLLKVTPSGSITRVVDISAKQGHVVPTSVAYKGNFFIGNLNTFPIQEGSSKIWKVTPSGEMKTWATGFTTILALVMDNRDRLYVLENTVGAAFPTPGYGRIVRLEPNGSKTIIATGLDLPTGMTMGPDGKLYVSNWGLGPTAVGGGQVLQVTVNE